MARCSWAQLQDEWSRSTSVLADIVGHPVTLASIPGGDYGDNVARAAAAAGIRISGSASKLAFGPDQGNAGRSYPRNLKNVPGGGAT